jgi:hypothetical protein
VPRITSMLLAAAVTCNADAVCKKRGISGDYVAVEELYSPECDDGADPFTKNAWEVAPARDGITECALPSYARRSAKVAQLVPCEHVYSPKCADRLDGLPNARILRSPGECVKYTPSRELRVACKQYYVGSIPDLSVIGYQIAQIRSKTCQPAYDEYNAWLIRLVAADASLTVPVCADIRNLWKRDFIVRRFHNEYCPNNADFLGADEGKNILRKSHFAKSLKRNGHTSFWAI